jgi:ATP-dependent helicase/DNAse subunit B
MPGEDKYSALWVSYSSMSTFLECPRAYFLSAVYKDPQTNRKISIINPPMALGQAVHEVIESLSDIETKKRLMVPLTKRYEQTWKKVRGGLGGFANEQEEKKYKDRGLMMLSRLQDHPGPIERLAVKIRMDLPNYWLSQEQGIILCGKIDWLEYLPDTDSVHIVDFKTGKRTEGENSLQLPIYYLLVKNVQQREVTRASYWYLETDDKLTNVDLPDLKEAKDRVLTVAKRIKLARSLNKLSCPKDGCRACRDYEQVLKGEAIKVGVNTYGQDLYIIPRQNSQATADIL